MFKSLEEVRSYCKENKFKMVDFMMIDINGRWRHLTMPLERLNENTMKYGIGFDGSNYGFAPVESSDMVLIPDLSTAHPDVFCEVPTLSMIGDVYVIDLPENRRFEQDPRFVARNAEEYLRSTGIADEFLVSPEFEFYVFDTMNYTVNPNFSKFYINALQAEWNSGSEENNVGYTVPRKGGYHIAPPLDRLNSFRSRVSLLMEKQGIKVKYHHHEVAGPGQIEIEVEFGGILEMADKTMMTKYLIKNAAAAENKSATFMPKPIFDEAGSGLHVHMHMFKGGKPLFYDEDGYSQLSETALYFIGGVLSHIGALCAFTNPSTNSYKRLVPGYEAPVTVGFATSNRSSVIRIPAYAKSPESKRFELRCPDGTCNPYYAYAAILLAGLDGIMREIDPVKEGYGPYDINFYNLSDKEKKKIKSLPKSLDEALDALEKDHAFLTESGVFPKRLIEVWLKSKRAELARYNQFPAPIEFELYYHL